MMVISESLSKDRTPIQVLRCDSAGEFMSDEYRMECTANKIRIEYSSPYSHHQGGRYERHVGIVMDIAR